MRTTSEVAGDRNRARRNHGIELLCHTPVRVAARRLRRGIELLLDCARGAVPTTMKRLRSVRGQWSMTR